MELILKILKYILLDENGEVNKSAVQKVKEAVLWILVGMALTIGITWYLVDDEEDLEEDTTEQVDQ